MVVLFGAVDTRRSKPFERAVKTPFSIFLYLFEKEPCSRSVLLKLAANGVSAEDLKDLLINYKFQFAIHILIVQFSKQMQFVSGICSQSK